MKHRFLYTIAAGIVGLVCLTACSTTSHLPEGETLYTGIKDITYSTPESINKTKRHKNDTTGVITAVADAVKSVDEFVSGKSNKNLGDFMKLTRNDGKKLTKQEKDSIKNSQKADEKALETVKEEVDAVLAYPPNNSLFGSSTMRSPLQFGLWFYNDFVNSKSAIGKWMFKTFATTPVYISSVNPDTRVKVGANTLHNYGYFNGKINYDVLNEKNPKKAKISYTIIPGKVSRLDSIAYCDFWPGADSLLKAHEDERLLRKGAQFNVGKLSEEQKRIETLFRNNGYFYYSAPYATFLADTTAVPYKVQLQLKPMENLDPRITKRWYIGNTHISIRRTEDEALSQHHAFRNYSFDYGGNKMPLRAFMWRHAISFRKGDLYSLEGQNMTQEKVNAIGVFSQMEINYIPRDTTQNCDTLDLYVSAIMDKLYDSKFELNAQFKSNQQVGPGLTYGLAKRNAFGAGEKVSWDIFGSYEWQTGIGSQQKHNMFLNSYEIGTKLSLEFPRFLIPRMGKRRLRFPATTSYSLDADWVNRARFFNMFSLGVSTSYQWHKRATSKHEFIPFSLDYDQILHSTASFDSIMNANPALYTSMRNQFIPAMSYTYTYSSPAQTRDPLWYQLSVKEAGNVVSGIYAAAGKKFNRQDKQIFGNPFAQFVKLTAEVHKSYKINPTLKVATRFFAGWIYSYGNSLRAPYAEQFYVGGANSIRGFAVRSVGPGKYHSNNSRYAYTDQTGDIRLEANAELRIHVLGNLYAATFLDAGNVWLSREDALRPDAKFSFSSLKNIAVGSGLGLRYDMDFIVLRFDVGVALHAPYETGKSGWYNIPKFKDGLAYHIAIGYPF